MKFINSSVEIIPQEPDIIGGFKHIEKAARNCYKSENLITDDSWEHMLDILKDRKHYSPLEHFTVYLTIQDNNNMKIIDFYKANPYSIVIDNNLVSFITTNFRVIVENDRYDDLEYMTKPTLHELRVTVKVNCSIGVSREWNRHRTFSISEQSTRYCNYSKDKFGSEITYIIPEWIYKIQDHVANCIDSLDKSPLDYIKNLNGDSLLNELSCQDRAVCAWMENLERTEQDYMYLIKECDFKPQEARSILPLDTATCVFYTGFVKDWEHFFDLRCSSAAHPDIRKLALELKQQLEERNYI